MTCDGFALGIDLTQYNLPSSKTHAYEGSILIEKIPKNMEEFFTLSAVSLDSPYKTAALTVVALCVFSQNKTLGIDILNYLRGNRVLTPFDIVYISDRIGNKNSDAVFSYFSDGEYKSVTVAGSYDGDDTVKCVNVYVKSNVKENFNKICLRLCTDGRWHLWEQFLLTDIQPQKSKIPSI